LAAPLLLIMLLRLTLPSAPVGAGVKVSLGPLLRLKVIWMLGLMHALCWGVVVSFGNWVPALLADAWGGSLVSGFAWAGALVMLLSGLGRFLGGFFLLRISATLLARGAVLVMAFVFAGLFLDPGPAIFFILFLLAVWLASVNFGAFLDLTGRASPADSVASAFGFVNFLGNLGVIFLTLLFGFLKDETGSFEWVFIVLAVWAVVAFWASRSLKRRDSANSAPA